MFVLAPQPSAMQGFSAEPSTELDQHTINYAACLRAMLQRRPKAYREFESFVKNVLPDLSSIENADRGKEGGSQWMVTFEQSQPHQTLQLDFDVLSGGEKCLFVAAYIVAANAARSPSDPPVICVWDEPDIHLSLSEVGHFITSMRKMTNLGGQFIATTHHPETMRSFADDNTFVLDRKSHLEPAVAQLLNTCGYSGDLINALTQDEISG